MLQAHPWPVQEERLRRSPTVSPSPDSWWLQHFGFMLLQNSYVPAIVSSKCVSDITFLAPCPHLARFGAPPEQQYHTLGYLAVSLATLPTNTLNWSFLVLVLTVFRSSTIGLTVLSFLLAEAIPFFNYILGLIGSICCSPTCVSLRIRCYRDVNWNKLMC